MSQIFALFWVVRMHDKIQKSPLLSSLPLTTDTASTAIYLLCSPLLTPSKHHHHHHHHQPRLAAITSNGGCTGKLGLRVPHTVAVVHSSAHPPLIVTRQYESHVPAVCGRE